MDYILNDIGPWIEENTPERVMYNIYVVKSIIPSNLGILPATTPYKIVSALTKYSKIPDSLRHKIRFESGFSYETSTPELIGKRITLSYIPASSSDRDTIIAYGTIYDTPAYLIEVRPVLRIDGEIVATGDPVGMGYKETFTISFTEPSV
jgi:hypothetical protein